MKKIYAITSAAAKRLLSGSLIFVVNAGMPCLLSAQGLSLDQSRIIFTAGLPQQVVTADNDSDTLYLIQSDLRENSPDGAVSALWFVTPPLFRLPPHGRQTVKILPQKGAEQLPADRESLFYFSATALPSVPVPAEDSVSAARVSVATRLVIKMFYRPRGLPLTYEEAAGSVIFTQSADTLCVSNPSPYYLTFSELNADGHSLSFPPGFMLPPSGILPVKVSSPLQQIQWRTLNDYGGNTPEFHAAVRQERNKC